MAWIGSGAEMGLDQLGPATPLLAIAGAALATYLWRALGVALSGRLTLDQPVFKWVSCVTYAMLAGLIARLIILPGGALAETQDVDRIAAAVIALAIFYLTRRNLGLGVAAGAGALVLITWGRLSLSL